MKIGKQGRPATSISTADAASVTVRGRDLTSDLMGRLTFTDYFFLLTTGREPTAEQRYFLDLLLISIAEHGLVPTNQAARMTYAADPGFLQGAVAAGLLGCGSVLLGTTEIAGAFLIDAKARIEAGETMDGIVSALRDAGGKLPGFGHPIHRPADPRAQRILSLAEERGVAGPYCGLARATEDAVGRLWPKPLPMNVSMAIPAVLLDLDFPVSVLKGIPLLARTASLIAHLAEEHDNPIGFTLSHLAASGIAYEPQES